ncbi:hypothetical protein [Amycolatopsis nigrescens]|uniref:hypothetical protein n=1 Tax=Amycolatopsis nigrescens TaxID=381445 RepID=UPI0003765AC3|nr:hypothetical protein [Amycolatopsis nigrescens]
MGWPEFHRRQDIIQAVLRQARRGPRDPLPFAGVPGAVEMFGTEQDLLLALQHKWGQLLGGYLRAAVGDHVGGDADENADLVGEVSRAWQAASREHETLRAVLDAHHERFPVVAEQRRAELRLLVTTAGLADPEEPVELVTRVGAVFDTLLRQRPSTRVEVMRGRRSLAKLSS